MVRYYIVSTARITHEVLEGPFFTMEAAQERVREQYLDCYGYTSCTIISEEDATDFIEITRAVAGG